MFQEWRRQTLPAVIRYGARTWPERTAILYQDTRISYLELSQRIACLREQLRSAGVRRGDHVAHLLSATPRWLEILFATADLGAVLIPLNLTWTIEEIAQGLQLTDANILLVGSLHKGQSLPERVKPLTSDHYVAALPKLRQILLADDPSTGPSNSFFSLSTFTPPAPHSTPEKTIAADIRSDDIAMLILTSGSTSFPKPAMHTHETVLCGSAAYADGLEACPGDIFFHCMPNYHVGSIATACLTLLRGGTLRLVGEFDAGEAMRLIDNDQASLFWGFDTHLFMMRDHPSYGKHDLSSLQRTMIAGNPATYEKIREMGFSHIGSLYGSTEYMGSQTYFPYRDRYDTERMKHSNGRPTSGEIRIAHPETGRWLDANETGEICVRGPALFKGYYKQPDATAHCLDNEGYFHSGDLGFMDQDGYLYYRGRLKEMIKSGGENVSALEVETCLLSEIPGISKAMVCGTPHAKWGEAVTALLVLNEGCLYTARDIQNHCRNKLAAYKIPKRILLVTSKDWPITPTGKLDRKSLETLARAHFGTDSD